MLNRFGGLVGGREVHPTDVAVLGYRQSLPWQKPEESGAVVDSAIFSLASHKMRLSFMSDVARDTPNNS